MSVIIGCLCRKIPQEGDVLMLETTEVLPSSHDDLDHLEDQALAILVARAKRRGDYVLALALSAVPPRSKEEGSVLMEADCPLLSRIAAICDPIETLAWRRALVGATVRGDRRRARSLFDLAARRCGN